MTSQSKTKQIYLFFLISLLLAACSRNKKIDTSNIHADVKVERFDLEFDAMKTKPMVQQANYLKKKYGIFYHDYLAMLFQDQNINVNDTAYFKLLRQVFATPSYNDLKHDIDSVYPNVNKPQADLTDAFKHV